MNLALSFPTISVLVLASELNMAGRGAQKHTKHNKIFRRCCMHQTYHEHLIRPLLLWLLEDKK